MIFSDIPADLVSINKDRAVKALHTASIAILGESDREERSRNAGRSFVQTLLETCSFGGVARVLAFDPESGYTYANR